MAATRSVLVEAARLDGWLLRFEKRNGAYAVENRATNSRGAGDAGPSGAVDIVAANGCRALLVPPLPLADARNPGTTVRDLTGDVLALHVSTVVGLILIRRGGYSVGVARAGEVIASKTGTRYVQGRTAAGGWSQQRFARRRANQADALVGETAARAAIVFAEHPPSCLQLGGDRALAADVLGESALASVSRLARTPFLTVPDPRLVVLKDAARSALSVRITVTDPPDGA